MDTTKDMSAHMLASLNSVEFRERQARAVRFERISGGGFAKQLERLRRDPGIYIPYVLNAKLGFSRVHSSGIKLFWGKRIRLPLDDYDALILYMYGGLLGSELKLSKFLIKNLRQGDVFYDIGANRGFYTYLASELCKEVHAFEAMAKLAAVVQKNVRPGEHIRVNAEAVSDKDGSVDFYLTESTMTNTINPSVASSHASRKITVPTTTIDTYVATHTKPTFLKIDAEGAEERIIAGGASFFSTNSPTIAMEVWGKQNEWEASMRAVEKLRSFGYHSFTLDDEGNTREVSGDLSAIVEPRGGDNFMFKK